MPVLHNGPVVKRRKGRAFHSIEECFRAVSATRAKKRNGQRARVKTRKAAEFVYGSLVYGLDTRLGQARRARIIRLKKIITRKRNKFVVQGIERKVVRRPTARPTVPYRVAPRIDKGRRRRTYGIRRLPVFRAVGIYRIPYGADF